MCVLIQDSNVVQFYSPLGDHLRTLKVPGKNISGNAYITNFDYFTKDNYGFSDQPVPGRAVPCA